uniref:Brinker DNA-binding domain-containing protein n=1 Tax=Meloidogyne javanica TaxID=6303 RepID=A0A915M5A3_MELJA
MTEDELIEIQDELEISEGKKRHRIHNLTKKLEAVNWARKNFVHSASRKFNVDRKIIRNWMKDEKKLEQQKSLPGGQNRKRLDGGGRKISHPDLDKELAMGERNAWKKVIGVTAHNTKQGNR